MLAPQSFDCKIKAQWYMMTAMQEQSARDAFLSSFGKNHSGASIIDQLTKLKNLKMLIIGDAILDQYQYTSPMGKESKEPLVVHRHEGEEMFAGGALATANHAASIVGSLTLVTVLGTSPSYASFIRAHVKKGVRLKFFYRDGSTIIKRRFIDRFTNQKLFQVSQIWNDMITPKLEKTIASYLARELPKYDCVMVNDFGHGFLTPKLIRLICRKAKTLCLNVQANSANYGFNIITKYPRADIATTDIHEIRLATHDRYADILHLAKKVARHLHTKTLVITRGPFGSTGYTKEQGFVDVPAFTERIVDRVGAGDALFSIISPCLARGMDLTSALLVGNVAAAIKIQSVGNKTPIEFAYLANFLSRLLP